MIGGRLDWIAFGACAERLLPQLLAQPIPYSTPTSWKPAEPVLSRGALRNGDTLQLRP